jgi:hypothetical protein
MPAGSRFATSVASEGDYYTIREWQGSPVLNRVSTPAEAIAVAVGRVSEGLEPDDLPAQAPEID